LYGEINELKKTKIKKKREHVTKGHTGNTQSETRLYLITMRKYNRQHFARMREIWKIKCIPGDVWENQDATIQRKEIAIEHTVKHENSEIQQYAGPNAKKKYIHTINGGGNK